MVPGRQSDLKDEPEAKLELAGGRCGGQNLSRRWIDCPPVVEKDPRANPVCRRRIKVRVVEDVEYFYPEFDSETVADGGVLDNREVATHQLGSNESISRFVTKATDGGSTNALGSIHCAGLCVTMLSRLLPGAMLGR